MQELTTEHKQKLLAPFEAAEIRIKTSPKVIAYITARTAMTRLDEVLPWQWDFEALDCQKDAGSLSVKGCLRIHRPDFPPLCFYDWGTAPPDVAKAPAKQYKHALSDALKRCAVHVGVGRYLYELSGVSGSQIPKAALQKALAAVGYRGDVEAKHCGAVGGVRQGDYEDDYEDDHAAPSATRQAAPPASPAPSPAPATTRPTVRLSDAQRAELIAAIEAGGGNPESTMFQGWLAKHTANHAQRLDDVLGEDVTALIAKLNDLAEKRRAKEEASDG